MNNQKLGLITSPLCKQKTLKTIIQGLDATLPDLNTT